MVRQDSHLARFTGDYNNIRIPFNVDRLLRRIVVTPDMHRVHHSVEDDETNSNFGFNLSCWDRLFGTYRRQPRHGVRGRRDDLGPVPGAAGDLQHMTSAKLFPQPGLDGFT